MSGVPTPRSRQTLTTELHAVPDFADAVRRHEVIAAIEKSAVCEKQPLRGWQYSFSEPVINSLEPVAVSLDEFEDASAGLSV